MTLPAGAPVRAGGRPAGHTGNGAALRRPRSGGRFHVSSLVAQARLRLRKRQHCSSTASGGMVESRRGSAPVGVRQPTADCCPEGRRRGVPMASLTLYRAAPSRSSIVRWMLEEVGQPYELHVLDLKAGEHRRPDYLAVNPMGKVPTLRHGDTIITEAA